MSIDRTYRCDGPDCERNCGDGAMRAGIFLTVTGKGARLHFCGWDCVLRYAGTVEPEEVIHP